MMLGLGYAFINAEENYFTTFVCFKNENYIVNLGCMYDINHIIYISVYVYTCIAVNKLSARLKHVSFPIMLLYNF